MRTIVVLLADTHAGHQLSLCNPDAILFNDAGFPEEEPIPYKHPLGAVQRWLWKHYIEDIAFVEELAKDDPVEVFHIGDITWGNRHPEGVIDASVANQSRIAAANFLPWVGLPTIHNITLVHGTQSHEFGRGTANDIVAHYLQASVEESIDVQTSRHALYNVQGCLFDCAHHGPTPGGRVWLDGNQLRYYLRSAMMEDILRGVSPPRVYVRAHYHRYAHETLEVRGVDQDNVWTSDMFLCPSYCGMTHFAQKVSRSSFLLACGLIAVEVLGEREVIFHPRWREIDLRKEEKL